MNQVLVQLAASYKSAVLALMIAEANITAEKLALPEDRPITEAKLKMVHVNPPANGEAAGGLGGIGTIESSKFLYAFGRKGKLSSMGRLDILNTVRLSQNELERERQRLAVPIDRIDTNAAWKAMLPLVRACILDADRLAGECHLEIRHGQWRNLHLPTYTARWTKRERDRYAEDSDARQDPPSAEDRRPVL